MILQGNQRGGAGDLARHLLKDENEHIEVSEIKGFVSGDLYGAFKEAEAVSKGTKAKQFLFSLSLNPPPEEHVSTQSFYEAITKVEEKLNLQNQPRTIVFHEKNGRRHCHAVWSRIDAQNMKAIPLPHSKRKLMELSRELYIEHGWKMPPGMTNTQARDPRNFTLAQWQQAKRTGKDPRLIKQHLQNCWSTSDNKAAFKSALMEHGYILAKGEKRGFVAINHDCEVFSLSKWVGVKAKDIRSKLGTTENLPSVRDAKTQMARTMSQKLTNLKSAQNQKIQARLDRIKESQEKLLREHKRARQALEQTQSKRQIEETIKRQARYRKGLGGLWDRLSGRKKRIERQNELEAYQAQQRDQREKDSLIFTQNDERRALGSRHERLDQYKDQRERSLNDDIRQYRDIEKQRREHFERIRNQKHDNPIEPKL